MDELTCSCSVVKFLGGGGGSGGDSSSSAAEAVGAAGEGWYMRYMSISAPTAVIPSITMVPDSCNADARMGWIRVRLSQEGVKGVGAIAVCHGRGDP